MQPSRCQCFTRQSSRQLLESRAVCEHNSQRDKEANKCKHTIHHQSSQPRPQEQSHIHKATREGFLFSEEIPPDRKGTLTRNCWWEPTGRSLCRGTQALLSHRSLPLRDFNGVPQRWQADQVSAHGTAPVDSHTRPGWFHHNFVGTN